MKDLPDHLKELDCNTCVYNLVLSVYITERTPELLNQLNKQNVHNVCMAFSNEGVAEIGTFNTSGCEGWKKRTKEQQEQRNKNELRIKNY